MYRLLRNNLWFRLWARFVRPFVRMAIRIDDATNGLVYLIIRALYRFSLYGPHEAAALSYYALFSLFPLMLLIIVISTMFFDSSEASTQLQGVLSFFFPGDTAEILQDAVDAAVEQRGSVSIFAIVVLGWSSSSLFGNLERVLALVVGMEVRRRIYERRLVGIVMIIMLGIFLIASVVTNLLFGLLSLIFLNQFNSWIQLASFLVPAAFNAAMFAMLYGFVPPIHIRWDAILPASLLGGISFEFAKRAFVFYLSALTNLDFVYGSVATVVVFMLWAFIIFCLILIFAEISAALNDWMTQSALNQRPVPNQRQLIPERRPPHLLSPPE